MSVPWSRAGSGFTLLFESYAMFLIENEMSVSRVARTLKVTEHRIWRVFNYWIEKAKSKDILTEINSICIDELKEIFLDIFKIGDINDAKNCLKRWCDSVVESNIETFIRFVDLIKSHSDFNNICINFLLSKFN